MESIIIIIEWGAPSRKTQVLIGDGISDKKIECVGRSTAKS